MKQSYSLSPDVENRIKAAVQALQEGRGILLVDDEERENEGDIIFPTSNLTPENIALIMGQKTNSTLRRKRWMRRKVSVDAESWRIQAE